MATTGRTPASRVGGRRYRAFAMSCAKQTIVSVQNGSSVRQRPTEICVEPENRPQNPNSRRPTDSCVERENGPQNSNSEDDSLAQHKCQLDAVVHYYGSVLKVSSV